MSAAETVYRACAGCGVTFGQPNDPGRKRQYHDDACKQRSYRARTGRTGHESRQESRRERTRQQWSSEQEAWANEEARKERERERSERRREERRRQQESDDRARQQRQAPRPPRGAERTDTPAWTQPNRADAADVAKRRRTCHLLYVRANHSGTGEHEARECRKKAESLRVIYGL